MATIENIDLLLSSYLKDNEKIVDTQLSPLTKPGDNYGSIVLKLDIKVKNENTKTDKVLHAVVKLIPRSNIMLKIFNTQISYKNELEFYRTVVPTLQRFQREQGREDVFDCVPKFIAGRLNLDPTSNVVNKHAVLVLENLKMQGYQTLNRTLGFDLQIAKLVIKKMVMLHTIPLALKFKNPSLFESNIKSYLTDFYGTLLVVNIDNLKQSVRNLIEDDNIVQKAFAAIDKRSKKTVKEPWATFIHNDLWLSNVMLKFYKNEPVDVKIVDFQICEYKSSVRDLIFFLLSSVRLDVLLQHLDDLLKFYYDNFLLSLQELNVDTQSFTWKSFNDEIKEATSVSEYYHVLYMLDVIHATEADIKDDNAYSEEDFGKSRQQTKIHQDTIVYVTNECVKRGWI